MNKQLDYFLKNFQLFYATKSIEFEYGKAENAKVVITQSVEESFWKAKNDINPDEIIWKEWKGKKIPFLFDKNSKKEIISYENKSTIINYDIVASAFYFLSGWNEYVTTEKDEYGRVKYENSIIKELAIANTPVVNYYFNILEQAIKETYGKEIKKTVWSSNNFAVSLTHDIDSCMSAWLEGSFSELKKKNFFSIPKLIFNRFFFKDDWFNFKTIMAIEDKFKAKSSFYFLPKKGGSGKWKNADYNITKKSIQQTIVQIKEKGSEASVHGSFGTHNNSDKFKRDIERMNLTPIEGNRFHFLMFDLEKSVSVLEDGNIKYDTTLGFAAQAGFRRGTCYPFYLWNFEKNRISTVFEIPLIVMDTTLAQKKYMGINKKEALLKVFELIDEVAKFNGVFTLLWHNNYFSEYKYTGWKDFYCQILEYCNSKNALLTSGIAIHNKVV